MPTKKRRLVASPVVHIELAEQAKGSSEPPSYLPEKPIGVKVQVRADKPTKCEKLELVMRLEGEGRGFSPPGFEQKETLFEGEWPAGTQTYERTLVAPDYPPTYKGEWISWQWWVEAIATLPGGRDERAKERFVLLTAPNAGLHLEVPQPEGPGDLRQDPAGEGANIGRLTIGSLGVIAFVIGIVLNVMGETDRAVWGAFVWFGGIAAVLFLVLPLLRRKMKSSEGSLDVAVALHHGRIEGDTSSGQAADRTLTCTVYTKPKAQIERVRARLEVNEFSEFGTQTKTNTRQQFCVTHFRRVSDAMPTGKPGEWRCTLPLPDDPVPYSLTDYRGHGLVWEVEVLLEHAGGLAPKGRIVRRIKARPARGPGAPSGARA